LRALVEEGIDPQLFDLMLSNELDRTLKRRFGFYFFGATISFTLLSYIIICANSIWKWSISDIAITALIVETPIQFIGLLYIIAKNLFPQSPALLLQQRGRPDAAGDQHTKGPSKPRQGKRSSAIAADD
jgi:hypothetical protein